MNLNLLPAPAPPWAVSTGLLVVRVVLGAAFEFFGGILLALGLFSRVASLALASVMVGALALVHIPAGHPFVASGGPSSELAAIYLAFTLLLTATGPGAYSLDALLFGRERTATPVPAPAPAH